MELKFFTMELNNAGELKRAFYTLIKKHHPDVGGCESDMKAINAEYEYLFNNVHELGRKSMTPEELKKDFHDLNDGYREQVMKVAFLHNIKIELIGSWLWVSGDTYKHYAIFKSAEFIWSKSKKAWYWYNGINTKKQYRKAFCNSLNEVKKYHGARTIELEEQKQLSKVA